MSESNANTDHERPLCRFFVMGTCKFGANCSFSHDIPLGELAEARKKIPCAFHQRERCRFGSQCVFSHDKIDGRVDSSKKDSINHSKEEEKEKDSTNPCKKEVSSASAATCSYVKNEENNCGICMDNIVHTGKRFGLLSNCDHRYCIDCLRKWRRSSHKNQIVGVAVTQTCPTCRVKSNLVMPTKKFSVGSEKEIIIENYKRKMESMPCRNFDGSIGSCPFGRNCFYAHFSWDGTDLKPNDECKSRKKQKRSHPSTDLQQVFQILMADIPFRTDFPLI